ncbi:CCR4-NOT transcription complex subunit 1-like [Adelges cooleyi]|uniref:CCR4-NOT transcription complex subunit 1-like n=1 Tax=Adelges cooleyi TaxID=133065 RepID=UPI00218019B0|nr:CCR4-NOT transcription complex subunit 1-like [Adelges cooleyi]XP_050425871.1 CCR4-NOT transcription complex subunit 1-like [Adelges cooleyi]
MNLDSLSYTLSQISFLVANLSRKNYTSSVQEILNAIQLQGFEVDRHLLRCLLSHIDLRDSEGPRSTSHKDYYQALLLAQQCKTLLNKPSLFSILCFALDNPLANSKLLKPSIKFFIQLSRLLHLSPVQEVVFGIVCLESVNYSTYALEYVKQKLPELIKFYINLEDHSNQVTEGGLHDSSPEVLHLILCHIFSVTNRDFGISKEVKNSLLLNLRRDFPLEVAPVLLAPLIYSNKPDHPMVKMDQETINIKMLDTSLADFMMEIGYSFCVSKDECKKNLMSIIAGNDVTFVFGPKSIANVLIMMIRSHSGLETQPLLSFWVGDNRIDLSDLTTSNANLTTWNVEAFVGAVLDVNPLLSWTEVVKELDQSDFMIKDRKGLVLLITTLRLALKKQKFLRESFPIKMFYYQWTNSDSQMSLLQYCLQNSDIFCFNDYPCRRVNVDFLNVRPGTENQDINNWRSIDLVDALFGLAERGHCYEIQDCLKYPVHNCPDILALALIQSNEPLNIIRHEVFSVIFSIFLGNHSNSDIVLNRAWNHQNTGLKHTLAQSMCDWYMRSDCDHVKLARILDIAQDLKALSFLLSVHQFTFIIDLACLASQREYLKLDKWLSDKIREHGENFIASCVKFLQKRCPQLTGYLAKDENFSKYTTLSSDTVLTMLNCLRNINSGNITPNLLEAIMIMVTNYTNMYMTKVPRINPIGPPPTLIRQPQHLRTMEASSSQIYVNQLSGLATSLTNIGLNPTSGSAFTLPVSLGHLIQAPISPSQNMFGNPSGFNNFSIMTSPSTSVQCTNMWSHLSVPPNMMSCMSPLPVTTPAITPPTKPIQNFENSMFLDNISDPMPKEIEDEANSYFQRIYSLTPTIDSLSIDGVLDMLKRFLESSVKREKDVFCCVLRNLFDEYRFFHEYPETELNITAQLFGGVIQHGFIVNYKVLCLALRFVLDSLKSPPDTKMYNFGIIALNRFKNRLKDYHQYCTHIAAIPHYHQFPPHLIEYVEYGKTSQEPPPSSRLIEQTEMVQGPVTGDQQSSVNIAVNTTIASGIPATVNMSTNSLNALKPSRPSFAIIPSVDSLLDTKNKNIIIPPESVQDKIAFIFNNLSQVNVQVKCNEAKEIIINDYLPWLSQYLIMRRVIIETNFHALYLNFVDCFDNARFNSLIMEDTLKSIKVLLGCAKDLNNFSERNLLKNLGHWYGMITIGKNRPVLMKDVDLKMLLVDSYSKGVKELLYTVPFITKVLESCSRSRIFKPKNPWTMAIMNSLAELHRTPALKLSLKFEVEVLCKTLQLNLMELQPSCILNNPELQKNPNEKPITDVEEVPVEEQMETDIPAIMTSEMQHTKIASAVQSVFIFNDEMVTEIVASGGIRTLTSSISEISPSPMIDDKYNLSTLENASLMSPIIAINTLVPRFVKIPKLKGCVWAAVHRTVRDWIEPVVQRTVKIAADTTIAIVKKDFSMDPDELLMRKAAHLFIEKITSSNALDRIREHVLYTLNLNLKQYFISVIASPKQAQIELIDKASTICANDHLGLTCSFIHQNVSQKAKLEIDDTLKTEYEKCKMESRRYAGQDVASNQAAQFLPDLLRNKVNLPTPQVLDLYDEYSKSIPSFQPLDQSAIALFVAKNSNPPDEMTIIYEKLINDVETLLQLYLANQRILSNSTQPTNLHSVLEALISLRRSRDVVTAANVVNKVLESFLDGLNPTANRDLDMTIRYRDTLLNIFRAFQDPRAYNIQWTNKTLTKALIGARDDLRYNLDAIDILIRAGMVNMTMYDTYLAMSMENGTNYVAMAYVKQFLQNYLIDNRTNSPITQQHLQSSIDAISSILQSGLTTPEGLASILEVIRPSHAESDSIDRLTNNNNTSTLKIQHGMLRGRDVDDPPGLLEKTEYLLKEWLTLYTSSPNRDPAKTFNIYIHQMNVQGILKSDDIITRFFRLSSQLIVELCYRQLPDSTPSSTAVRTKLSNTIDAYVNLIVMLVKHSGDTNAITIKTNLLNKVLGIIVGVLLQDHQLQGPGFYQLPYHRMLSMLFLELNTPDPVLESINSATLAAYCHTYHLLRPKKVPGFAFAWIELISNRVFIGRILSLTTQEKRQNTNDQKQNTDVQGWNFYAQLLVDLLKYLAPFLRNTELAKPVQLLYKGALRIMLILLHDFPEFLCEYHYGFCDAVPPNCVQMRNLILSAFPRNMRLPDPFTPNLKVDVLKEIAISPKIGPDFQSNIQPQTFKNNLDLYLKTRSPVTFLSDIRSTLQQTSVEPGMRYNLSLLNAIVLYVGTQAIQHIRSKGQVPNTSTIAHSAHMDIFQNLSVDLDNEGRYLFLNSMVNHLRFPNSHTHYFSCTLLLLFAEANSEAIQEQITRVLLERLIVNRPHPWGLLITFIELIKNPLYKFWDHEFVHCAPEIEKLFESVARSCMVHKQTSQPPTFASMSRM